MSNLFFISLGLIVAAFCVYLLHKVDADVVEDDVSDLKREILKKEKCILCGRTMENESFTKTVCMECLIKTMQR